MKQITLIESDKVGVLADLSYILGKTKVNIESISAEAYGKKAIINMVVDDEKKAESVLRANGYHVLATEMIVIKLADRPGQLAEISNLLKKEGVSIESIFIVSRGDGHTIVALKADKTAKAKKVLGPYSMGSD